MERGHTLGVQGRSCLIHLEGLEVVEEVGARLVALQVPQRRHCLQGWREEVGEPTRVTLWGSA